MPQIPTCAWEENPVWNHKPFFSVEPLNCWFLLEDPQDREYLKLVVNKKKILLENPASTGYGQTYKHLRLHLLTEAALVAEYASRLFQLTTPTRLKVHFNSWDKSISRLVYENSEEVNPFHKKFFGTSNRQTSFLHESLRLMYWTSCMTQVPGTIFHGDGDAMLEDVQNTVKTKLETLLERHKYKLVFRNRF